MNYSWAIAGRRGGNPQIHRKDEIFWMGNSYLGWGIFQLMIQRMSFSSETLVRMGNAADLTFNTDSVGVEEHHRRLKKKALNQDSPAGMDGINGIPASPN